MNLSDASAKPRGRPRRFDRDAALDAATRLFWQHGYDATAISDLAEAMAINPPSLYAAFGDKKALFFAAIEKYQRDYGSFIGDALAGDGTARTAIEAALRAAVRAYSRQDCPAGCMVVLAATNCRDESADVAAALRDLRRATQQAISRRIEEGQHAGDVPLGASPDELAQFYASIIQGLSIQARDGASLAELERIVDRAMLAWPEAK